MTSHTFNTRNTPLAMAALLGTPDQLRESLASRSNIQPIPTSKEPLDYLESYIKEMIEYDRMFGVDFMKPENPFKMVHNIPEDTTEDWMLYLEEHYQVYDDYSDSLEYLSQSEGTDSENEDDFIAV